MAYQGCVVPAETDFLLLVVFLLASTRLLPPHALFLFLIASTLA
jgi:hypothetical protein